MVSVSGDSLQIRFHSDAGNNFVKIESLGNSETIGDLSTVTSEFSTGDTVTNTLKDVVNPMFTLDDIDRNEATDSAISKLINAYFGGYWKDYYVLFSGAGTNVGFRSTWLDGAEFHNWGSMKNYLESLISSGQIFIDTSHVDVYTVLKGSHDSTVVSPAGRYPSLCNNTALVRYRWDGVSDLDIFVGQEDETGIWVTIDSTITSQADLKAWLEAVYEDDDYNFAYHVTTGDICIEWVQNNPGAGTFTFSVQLQDNIIVEDQADAWVVRENKRTAVWF